MQPVTKKRIRDRRWFRWTLRVACATLLLAALLVAAAWVYFRPPVAFIPGVAYGTRNDQPLVMDVVIPREPNGRGILVMVSGRWRSRPRPVDPWIAAPLLRRGYTLFAVHHVSQPKATIMEIVDDVQRAVRFVRHNSRLYGVDPASLGVLGASSGGHLSLMIATRGGPGDPNAEDVVDRESSAVQAAAVFFPVTDLLNLGDSTQNLHDGGPPKSYVRGFGLESRDLEPWLPIGRAMSPIFHITPELPPVLLFHGTKDTLVPFDQSTRFQAQAKELGLPVELIPREGKGHGWLGMIWDIARLADWFDRQLGNVRATLPRLGAADAQPAASAANATEATS